MRINGYAQEQKTWARVSGYVEQSDIHSPQVTPHSEPCLAWNRLSENCLHCQCHIRDGH